MTTDISLIKFKAISNFTECLSEVLVKSKNRYDCTLIC